MPKTTTASPLTPMDPDAAISVFNYLRAVEAGDIEAAAEFAGTQRQMAALLVDVAERIVALGRVFLDTLRTWEQVCPATADGIAHAIIAFAAQILTEDHEDVADILKQLEALAVGQALDAHPAPTTGAHSVRLTAV